jgi:hypothetical protein
VLFALDVAFLENRGNLYPENHRHQGAESSSKAVAIEKRTDVPLCQVSSFIVVALLSREFALQSQKKRKAKKKTKKTSLAPLIFK